MRLLSFLSLRGAISSGAPITVTVEDVTGNPGDKVTVKVFVELQPEATLGIAGMDIKIEVDTSVVTVDPGDFFNPGLRILLPTFGNNSTNVPETQVNLIGAQSAGFPFGFADFPGGLPNPAAVAEFDLNVVGNPGDVSPRTTVIIDVGNGVTGLSVGDRGTTSTSLVPIDVANNGSLSIPVDIAGTTVVAARTTLKADGADTTLITVTPRDSTGSKISATLNVSVNTTAGSVGSVTAETDSTYTAVLTASNFDETAVVTVTIVGSVAPDSAVVVFAPFSDIDVTPTSLDYGVVLVGSIADDIVSVTNLGNGDLVLGTLSITGADASEFYVFTPPNTTIAAGDTSDAIIRFSPVSGGPKSATLLIPNNDPDAADDTVSVALAGVGGEPNITVVDTADFGSVSTIGAPKDIDLEILSDGGLQLEISTVTLTGPGAAVYTLLDNLDGVILPALTGKDTLAIRFTPTSVGPFTADVTIFSDDPDTPAKTVALLGTGIEPDIAAAPFDFGPVEVDSQKTDTLIVNNVGTDDLNIDSLRTNIFPIPFDAFPFGSLPTAVSPGGLLKVVIQFQPDSVGVFNDTVTVFSDDPDSPSFKVPLTGIGVVPAINIAPLDTLTITDRIDTTGGTGKTTTGAIAVGNQGGIGSVLDVTYTFEDITGGGTATFSVDGASAPSPARVPDGSSINIVIAFASIDSADTLQPRFARVIIESDDANSVDTVIVQGISVLGPSPKPRAEPASLDYDGVFAGTTKDLQFVLGNGPGGSTADPDADTTFVITEAVISGDTLSNGSFVFSICSASSSYYQFRG